MKIIFESLGAYMTVEDKFKRLDMHFESTGT
jgi:hypothetical protein